jgi:hypothetical protein
MKPIHDVLVAFSGDETALIAEKQARDAKVAQLRQEMLQIHGCLETCWAKKYAAARAAAPANLKQTILKVGGK